MSSNVFLRRMLRFLFASSMRTKSHFPPIFPISSSRLPPSHLRSPAFAHSDSFFRDTWQQQRWHSNQLHGNGLEHKPRWRIHSNGSWSRYVSSVHCGRTSQGKHFVLVEFQVNSDSLLWFINCPYLDNTKFTKSWLVDEYLSFWDPKRAFQDSPLLNHPVLSFWLSICWYSITSKLSYGD